MKLAGEAFTDYATTAFGFRFLRQFEAMRRANTRCSLTTEIGARFPFTNSLLIPTRETPTGSGQRALAFKSCHVRNRCFTQLRNSSVADRICTRYAESAYFFTALIHVEKLAAIPKFADEGLSAPESGLIREVFLDDVKMWPVRNALGEAPFDLPNEFQKICLIHVFGIGFVG